MVQLQVISGKQAGILWEARRFPVQVGRSAGNDLSLEDDGVWEQHFQITSAPDTGFTLSAQSGALVMVNQTPVESVRLKNGDLITAGAAKLSFRLSPTRQRGLRLREWFVWSLIAGITAAQLAFVVWLIQ